MATTNTTVTDSSAEFRTKQGAEVHATLLSLTAFAAAFQVHGADFVIRSSEVLESFRIVLDDKSVYSGRAVVRDVVNTGTTLNCSVVLDDASFDAEFFAQLGQPGALTARFNDFVERWQAVCRVLPEFKVAVADIETFLIDLRRWLEQIELGIRSSPSSDRMVQERRVIDELNPHVLQLIDALFEKFEAIATRLEPEAIPVHRSYIQRHLHPIVLCAPFAWRSYHKPLGYAGDYEMVNMMLRDPQEGSSLFAKIFNVWLLHQGSAAAHRNRIEFLKQRLIDESARIMRSGGKAQILNLGCGPAQEVQEFLADSQLSDSVRFTLFDFNEETLRFASQALRQKQQQFGRSTAIELAKRSVQQLLKDMVRAEGISKGNKFDFIYCAGLFDYLPDRTCKRLMTLFYQSLAPGGLVLATNVAPLSPNRGSLELILDWHLIYRNARQFATLHPDGIPGNECRVASDETGVNLFLEARKPNVL